MSCTQRVGFYKLLPWKAREHSADGESNAVTTTKRILCIVGTRPEAIKMAPVILGLQREVWADVKVIATAQHRQMLDQTLAIFGIVPDCDLDLMRPNQALAALTARALESLDARFVEDAPDLVLAQGDTTTVLAAAMAAFYRRIPFGHVEAGLRTFDLDNPFPEEFNRIVAGRVTRLHFAPTESARRNLLNEKVDPATVLVTGNTVIDALLHVTARNPEPPMALDPERRLILVTVHRRENFGEPLAGICDAIEAIVEGDPTVEVLWPVHPNPNVSGVVRARFATHPRIRLVDPLDYLGFAASMNRAFLVLTDSGGVQEEAPALAKPVLVLRSTTERPEAVDTGVARLIGTDTATIIDETRRLLNDEAHYRSMARGASPYGDGKATGRIVEAVRKFLCNR